MPTVVFPEPSILDPSTVERTDLPAERVVLWHLLDQHPRRLTLEDLAGEVGPDPEDEAIRRAVDNLAAARLLRREGPAWVPSRAVVDFDRGSPAAGL
jgi:hypothetical protein